MLRLTCNANLVIALQLFTPWSLSSLDSFSLCFYFSHCLSCLFNWVLPQRYLLVLSMLQRLLPFMQYSYKYSCGMQGKYSVWTMNILDKGGVLALLCYCFLPHPTFQVSTGGTFIFLGEPFLDPCGYRKLQKIKSAIFSLQTPQDPCSSHLWEPV